MHICIYVYVYMCTYTYGNLSLRMDRTAACCPEPERSRRHRGAPTINTTTLVCVVCFNHILLLPLLQTIYITCVHRRMT